MRPSTTRRYGAAKVGMLLANLGTPDNYDYWSMRRYLSEFLSDKRVIDYPALEMAAAPAAYHPDQAPLHLRRELQVIWNHEKGESPLMTITKDQTAALRTSAQARFGAEVMVDFCMRYGNPSTAASCARWSRRAARRSCSSRSTRIMRARPLPRRMTPSSAR